MNSLKNRLNRLKANEGLIRYFFNTAWMLSDQVLRLLAGVVVGIWVARYLGPTDYGLFNYVVAFVAIFGTLAKFGLDSIVVRNLVTDPDKRDEVLGTGFWLKFTGALLTLIMIGIYLALGLETPTAGMYMMILAAALLFQSFEVIDFYFQAKVLSRIVSISKTIQLIISSLVKIYLVYIQADLVYFILVQFLDQVTLGITQYVVYKIYVPDSHFLRSFRRETAVSLVSHAWPLIFGSIAIMIYMRIDQIMIMKMIGEREMGLFSAAVRLSEAWYFVPMVITNSLFPAILNAKQTDEREYKRRLVRLFQFMFAISVAVALPISLLAPWLITLLFGEEFAGGAPVLALHVWTGVFTALGVASSGWFIAENLLKFSLLKTILGAGINILANFALIPRFGIMGAAVSTIICQACVSVLFNVFHPRARDIFKLQMQAFRLGGPAKTSEK